MKRREFITGLVGAATWPVAAWAQTARVRRIGMLSPLAKNDPSSVATVAALLDGLGALGWHAGRNLSIDYRFAEGDNGKIQGFAKELVDSRPELIVGRSTPVVAALQRATKTIPIIFTQVTDAEQQGFVSSLAHPGGNITGFTHFEPSLGGKWLEKIREVIPKIETVAVLYNPVAAPFADLFLRSVDDAAKSLRVTYISLPFNENSEIRRSIQAFAREPYAGLIVIPDAATASNRNTIIAAAAEYRLPAIYPFRFYAADGGLMSYGSEPTASFQQAASYIDRIIKGAKVGDLPVQTPTKFDFVINLKTAKMLGIEVPFGMQQLADEVIE